MRAGATSAGLQAKLLREVSESHNVVTRIVMLPFAA